MRTPAAIALDSTYSLSRHLQKLDLDTTEETEKIQLVSELQTLKNLIDKIIS